MEPFAAWIERDVVHAHGRDAVTFLQGQLSQEVATLSIGTSAWSLLLDPAGKVVAWLRVTRVGDTELVLDTDAGAGPAVVARLERFRLRTDCTLDLATEPMLAIRGVDTGAGMPVVWPGVAGRDLLGPSAVVPAGVSLLDAAAYEEARVAAGVPRSGVDLTDHTIPAEAGQWLIDASVSFTKGCYTGQELVARIDSRGAQVPRPLRRIRLTDEAAADAGSHARTVAPGDEVTLPDGKQVGVLTSVAGGWGLGPVGRGVVPPARVLVAGRRAEVLE